MGTEERPGLRRPSGKLMWLPVMHGGRPSLRALVKTVGMIPLLSMLRYPPHPYPALLFQFERL